MSKINLEYIFPTALYTIQLEGIEKVNKVIGWKPKVDVLEWIKG